MPKPPLDPVKRYKSLLDFIFEPLTRDNWRAATARAARMVFPFDRQFYVQDVPTLHAALALQRDLRSRHDGMARDTRHAGRRSVKRTIEYRFSRYVREVTAYPRRIRRQETCDVRSVDGKILIRQGEWITEWRAPSVLHVAVCGRPGCGRPFSLPKRPDKPLDRRSRNRMTCPDPQCRDWADNPRRSKRSDGP
jgi:hypothetical protein